jgi:RNA polymerase sigma factor (sigma-70 family)
MVEMMNDDMELARKYAASHCERSFESLVARHINLVYSVALRQTGDPHVAEEITQAVFVILARKANTLGPKTIVSGWLCRTARHVAANALTMQRRRQRREQEAFMQSLGDETESRAWAQIAPLLDTALAQLGERDHNAIALRFFERKNFREVGAALGASEDAAKKRVQRALEKLRAFFQKRGVALSVAAIAGAISARSVHAAPAGLASSVAAAANPASATASTLTIVETTLKIMAWTKLKSAVALGALAVLASGGGAAWIHHANVRAKKPSSAFAGYATPEASVESMIWSTRQGTLDDLRLAPEEAERFKARMAGKSSDEIRRGIVAWGAAMAGYKITQKDVISGDEVHLHIHAPASPDALRTGKVVLVMRKIGDEWVFAGDAR